MALIAFASAKGSPGVSVTSPASRSCGRDRAVVADLDPAGGDTGLRYRAENGDPLNPSTGLLSLGAAVRSGQRANLEDHLQTTAGGMRTLVGVTTPGQVLGLGPAWQHIALTLRRAREYDVLADCGRLTPGSPAMAVIDQADAVVLVSGGELEDIAHLRERLRGLQASLHLGCDRRHPDRHRDGDLGLRHPRTLRRRAAAGLGWPARASARRHRRGPQGRRRAAHRVRPQHPPLGAGALAHRPVRAHQRPDQPDRPRSGRTRARGNHGPAAAARPAQGGGRVALGPASRGRGQRPAHDELGGRAPVRPRGDRSRARGPRRQGDRCRAHASVGHRGGRARRGHPRRAVRRRAGCSRCSTTPRSRTSTSTAATRSSSATPTARRSASRRSPRPTRS